MPTNREQVLISLGFFKNDDNLDYFQSNFGHGWKDDDLNEAIGSAGHGLANARNRLVETPWLKVMDDFVDDRGCGREMSDCHCERHT